MAVVPLRVSNRLGFGMLEVQSIAEGTGTTTFKFNDHPQRRINFFGGFWVKIPQDTSTGYTADNVIEFATIDTLGSNIPLKNFDGSAVTMGDLSTSGGGIILCFYDRTTNRLQLVNAF